MLEEAGAGRLGKDATSPAEWMLWGLGVRWLVHGQPPTRAQMSWDEISCSVRATLQKSRIAFVCLHAPGNALRLAR